MLLRALPRRFFSAAAGAGGVQPASEAATTVVYEHVMDAGVVHVNAVTDEAKRKSLGKAQLFAVVALQGKQYRVLEGDRIMTDRIPGVEVGSTLPLNEVLLVGGEDVTVVGRPLVEGTQVSAVVEEHTETEKIHVFKKKRRKGYRRRMGHKSDVTVLRITSVKLHQ